MANNPNNRSNLKTHILGRISRENPASQQRSVSLQQQFDAGHTYAVEQKWRNINSSSYVGSAYNQRSKHPELKDRNIICYSVDRFSRSIQWGMALARKYISNNCHIHFIRENLIVTKVEDFGELRRHLNIAETESRNIGNRIKAANAERKRQGTYRRGGRPATNRRGGRPAVQLPSLVNQCIRALTNEEKKVPHSYFDNWVKMLIRDGDEKKYVNTKEVRDNLLTHLQKRKTNRTYNKKLIDIVKELKTAESICDGIEAGIISSWEIFGDHGSEDNEDPVWDLPLLDSDVVFLFNMYSIRTSDGKKITAKHFPQDDSDAKEGDAKEGDAKDDDDDDSDGDAKGDSDSSSDGNDGNDDGDAKGDDNDGNDNIKGDDDSWSNVSVASNAASVFKFNEMKDAIAKSTKRKRITMTKDEYRDFQKYMTEQTVEITLDEYQLSKFNEFKQFKKQCKE